MQHSGKRAMRAQRHVATFLVAASLCASAQAADVAAGRAAFRQQCLLCHTAENEDGGGAQGPSLIGSFGRRAASNGGFAYTQALRDSNLTWDAATLDRFLQAPSVVVPGSSMVIPVAQKADRENVVAYLQSVAGATAAVAASGGAGDWRSDAPGRLHHVRVQDLPEPFATPSVRNAPRIIAKPDGAELSAPAGFKVSAFADKLQGPRTLRVAPNGDVFVTETQAGRIKVLRPSRDGASVASSDTFADGLRQPFGVAFYPANAPQWLYVAETNRVVRYAYGAGDLRARGAAEVVVPELTPVAGGHYTRDLAFSRDGKRMFVSVGSMSNVAEGMPNKTPAEIKAWEAEHGVGSAWEREVNRAMVLEFAVDAAAPPKTFATGIRNCVGLTVQPANGELWCTTNERDGLGDNLVPDYSTRVKEGGFYGWPWYYLGAHEDPRLKGARPDLRDRVIVPDVLYTAHSAALTLTFYAATTGAAAFPKDYVGDGFAALHGSWNRSVRTGHKVVRVRMKNNMPTGEYEDFLTGFIESDSAAWGRPVGLAVAKDGALLVSDDGGNMIHRISYSR